MTQANGEISRRQIWRWTGKIKRKLQKLLQFLEKNDWDVDVKVTLGYIYIELEENNIYIQFLKITMHVTSLKHPGHDAYDAVFLTDLSLSDQVSLLSSFLLVTET